MAFYLNSMTYYVKLYELIKKRRDSCGQRDYYEVLGISKDASKDEIKSVSKAFEKYHQILTKKKVQMKSLKKFLKPMKF